MTQIELSQYVNDCKYVILENIEGFELSGVHKFDIADSLIVISDFRNCLLYDLNGNFISTIGKRGNGPGEYEHITNVKICNKKIFIQSLFDLNIYDKSGLFLRKYKNLFLVNNEYISSWYLLEDSLFFGKVDRASGKEDNKAIIFEINGKIISEFPNYIFLNRKKPLAGPDESEASIFKFKEDIFFKERCNDTLFLLTSGCELKPLYKFDFGKYTLQFLQGEEDLQNYVQKLNNYIWLENLFSTPKNLYLDCNFNGHFPAKRLTTRTVMDGINLDFNTTHVLGIYNTNSHDLIFCKPAETDNPLFTSGFFNDIDAGPKFFPQKQINDSTMVMLIETKLLKEHILSNDFKNNYPKYPEKKSKLEILASSLTVFDNPVLMFATFIDNN